MTTIITRLFPDEATAQSAFDRLTFRGMPKRDCKIILAGPKAPAMMERAQVHEDAISTYAGHLSSGQALLVVHATYKPLGAVNLTREILAKYDTVDCGNIVEEYKTPWKPERAPSVMKDHPLFFSIPGLNPPGSISASFGIPLLKQRRAKNNLMSGDRRMSRKFWPMRLVSKRRHTHSAMRGGRHMSRMFWPMPLIAKGPRRKSVSPGGGLPFSRLFGLRTISLRR